MPHSSQYAAYQCSACARLPAACREVSTCKFPAGTALMLRIAELVPKHPSRSKRAQALQQQQEKEAAQAVAASATTTSTGGKAKGKDKKKNKR